MINSNILHLSGREGKKIEKEGRDIERERVSEREIERE